MEGGNQVASTSSSTSGSAARGQIEFHMSRKPFFPLNGSNFKPQNRCVSDPPRSSHANLENGLDNDVRFHMIVRRIGAGLENLGNTCFLNSVLQCLTYTEPLVAYLLSGKHENSCHIVGFCALCAIQKHIIRALQSTGRILAPKDLVSNLRRISRNFRNARQEDAHEYMVHLLESMHKCCLPSGIPCESPSAYEKSLVHKIFGGCLRSQVKCMQCSYCSNKYDPFLDLSLEIVKADSLHKALSHFTAAEQLDGGERQYQCQQCKQKVRASKQLTIDKAPYVLTIHLKRFGSHSSGQKIDKKVHFGPTLNLKPFVSGSYGGELKYTLYGVLVHNGWSTHSGHYYCFVRTSSGVWYSLDDSRVYQVSEKTVLEQKAYMLFYVRDGMNFGPRNTANGSQSQRIVPTTVPNGSYCMSSTSHRYMSTDKPVNAVQKEKAGSIPMENGVCSSSATCQGLQNKSDEKSVIVVQKEKAAVTALQRRWENDSEGKLQNMMLAEKFRSNDATDVLGQHHLSNVHSLKKSSSREDSSEKSGSKELSQSSVERKDHDLVLKLNGQHLTYLRKDTAVDPSTNNDVTTITNPGASVTSGDKSLKTDLLVSVVKPSEQPADIAVDMIQKTTDKAGGAPEEAVAKQSVDNKYNLDRSSSVANSKDGLLSKAPSLSSHQKVKRKSVTFKVPSMHLSTRVMYRASLSLRKRKKRKKVQKEDQKFAAKNLMDEELGPSTSHLTGAVVEVCCKSSRKGSHVSRKSSSDYVRNNGISAHEDFVSELKRRTAFGNTVLAVDDQYLKTFEMPVTSKQQQDGQPSHLRDGTNTVLHNVVADNPTKNLRRNAVVRRDGTESLSSQTLDVHNADGVSIGYVADEWDEDYDRGKRKKVRTSKDTFGGPNPFQEVAAKAAKLKVKRKHYNLANQPFRI